ncbi:aminodeoxychorismate synthase component I [Desulfofustis limnaeus]|jgi:para-aminobenzoate synthetase/4-amino-4-deoxychorismate lyase|uniref:Para-aminobenzoate synthetase n=1 Tax=Desulfofustis limnaeus TaxID=2740163 RepID=A0ABN6M3M5_9BACT|nr:aminodeoxychorismate synthase component I [Desulfofustis limnaeus]MDX9895671.1 aminodeoxychorismate synthase component I [Desulfofustis sp.]BDD86376.1 para-aminobenzoate synthetase [Desulfofustis limnaeus]
MIGRPLSDERISALLDHYAEDQHFLLLDTAKPDADNYQSLLFINPVDRLVCRSPADRPAFLKRMQSRLDRGEFLAGWFAYEFFGEGPHLRSRPEPAIYAEFGVYPPPLVHDHRHEGESFPGADSFPTAATYQLSDLAPNLTGEEYCRAIRRILDYIAAGDTYQVNYTCKMHFRLHGSITRFYRDLRRSQPVPYGCFQKSGDRYILSFSPELFFRAGAGRIIARPMKGTAKRGRSLDEDQRLAELLRTDIKNRSENVMIVDLLRNDLSRLLEGMGGGRVAVPSLFDVERYQTVLQMTSTVTAGYARTAGPTPDELIRALFPCGSVTGAPKIRTMEIIRELEHEPRGVYTGAIGYFSPDGGAVFNVPIRTVAIDGERGEMGIGSGIVADSDPEDEWRECLLKARFLTNPLPDFELVETMLYQPVGGYLFFDDHLQRLSRSAEYYGFTYDAGEASVALAAHGPTVERASWHRVRLTLARHGAITITSRPCAQPAALALPDPATAAGAPIVTVGLAGEPVDSANPWLFHKTTHRPQYERALKSAQADNLFDLVFCNERDELTEGCISNIFVLIDGCYLTPPESSGLLAGVMRNRLLTAPGPVPVREQVLTRADLLRARRIVVCNSVRGVQTARLQLPEPI